MKPFLSVVAGLLLVTGSARADTLVQDFEAATNPFFKPVSGWNEARTDTDVSITDVSTEQAHSGAQSARLKYQLSEERRLNVLVLKYQSLPMQGDTLYFSMWVRGAGKSDFKFASLWMMDNATEDFRIEVPGLVEALSAKEWRQVRGSWKLSELQKQTFAGNQLHPPLYWWGLWLFQNGKGKTQGTVFFDDVVLSDAPIGDPPLAPATKAP